MNNLNDTVIFIGTLIIFISLIFSLFIHKRKYFNNYLIGFFFCPLIALMISVNTISLTIFIKDQKILNYSIQNILLLLDLIFWRIFFLNLFKENIDFRRVNGVFIVTLILAFISYLFNDLSNPNLHTLSIFNICKTIFCIYYFYKLFKNIPNKNIKLEPAFWIITGLLFYSVLSIPFYTLHSFIRSRFSDIFARNIFAISNILIIVMHIFFIKAYLCIIQQPKAS